MTTEKWIITAAWPYVNTVPHLGTFLHLLSGDVITRYHKLLQHDVVYVSGSDAHGTPIVVAAEKEGIPPSVLAEKYHKIILELLEKWSIQFDKYSITNTKEHISFVQEFHKIIHQNNYYELIETEQYFCQNCKRFLPDRFVEGTCPKCNEIGARGDQCSNPSCEVILKPTELLNPYCTTCKNKPILRTTKHWYFDLPRLAPKLKEFAEKAYHIPSFARQKVLSLIDEGLVKRPISRDMSWGINISPIFGKEYIKKVLYVWFENVLGYVSTVDHIAKENKDPNYFKDYWLNPNTKTVFCLGKDNIIFHALIFPALLLASGKSYPLPHALAVTNFLVFKEGPFSKSKGIGIWSDEAVALLPADYWRYYLISNRPELKDVYFDWNEFAITINNDLNDVLGNFINRILSFINKQFGGIIPKRNNLKNIDEILLSDIDSLINDYKDHMNNFELKKAVQKVFEILRIGNQYFTSTEPWHLIKNNKQRAETILNLSTKLTEIALVLLWPIIPNSIEVFWDAFGFEYNIPDYNLNNITFDDNLAKQTIKNLKPIFFKVDAKKLIKELTGFRSKK